MTVQIDPVGPDEWPVVAWLWQCFRHDLAPIVDGLPYADGRYQARALDGAPRPDHAGYLARSPHPRTGEPAPVGFAVVGGLGADRRTIDGFWVVPAARRGGLGRTLAGDVIGRHPGPWTIAFQHDNAGAGMFWRAVAIDAFGATGWVERRQPVTTVVGAPDDHVIDSI